MWVLDASAAAELLLGTDRGLDVEAALGADDIYAPQLLAVEVLSVLRGMVRGGHLAVRRAEAALDDLEDLGLAWTDLPPLLGAAWTWRHNISAYDAVYVALAASLDCRVLTWDRRLSAACDICVLPGPR
ncbi:type II toxin-antitoxin system VapC family toxin [Actinomyces gerencseriae]|jgi:toxin-antitoxin system, toxin component, PIN family|uniref:type II toxin-antitoxin system VapC family toxin n=1 Tax=Actinomyces gerencseriae TaxID=52769 RepID=UPI0023F1CC50|nr:type II toxin-antitoxin system VapC family toxin [Actinomyces gerencseriae]